MAENAVYLSSIEHKKPTIFEIWAEESFMSSLRPAFHLLCDFVHSKLPSDKIGPFKIIFKYPDESFLVFNLILQTTYLDWFSSSFSESFYGLKRVSLSQPSQKLPMKAKLLSLFGIVGAPYVSMKLKGIVDKYMLQSSENNNSIKLLKLYKTSVAVLNMIRLIHYLSYLGGVRQQHSVFHWIAGVQLVHDNRPSVSWSDILSLLRHESSKSKLIGPLSFKLISQLFEFGAFSLQFINWWNSSDSEELNFNQTSIPGPVEAVNTKNLCPICKNPWKIEVVLSTSGIVYCYSCIIQVLNDTGKCPVTGVPFSLDDLVRLYPSVT